jgi:hypothetical protein
MNLQRFLLSVIDDGSVVDGPEIMPAIDQFNDKLRAEGHWIFAWGLHSPERSHVIDNREGRGLSSEGPLIPYSSGSEYISGIWLIQAESEEIALALAAEGSLACNRKVEFRPFH